MGVYDQGEVITLFNGGTAVQPSPGVWRASAPGRYRDFRSVHPQFTGYGTLHEERQPVAGTDSRLGTVIAHKVELITDAEENTLISVPQGNMSILEDDEKCKQLIELAISKRNKSET